MSLSVLSQIAEIIAAIGVIISLVFVGLQVRANTHAARSAAAHDAMSGIREFYMMLGGNGQACRVWHRALTAPETISPEEMVQFVYGIHSAFLAFQTSYSMTEEGTLDPEIRDSITSVVIAVKDLPGFRQYWSERREFFKAGFRNYVDATMKSRKVVHQTMYQTSQSEE